MKFALEWIGDRVAIADAGGTDGVRKLLDRAGLPVESAEGEGEGVVLDVEITPNRPDAMSHRGLAREVAAMAGIPFRDAGAEPELSASGPPVEELASVEIAVPRLCRRFGARVVRGIANAPSSPKVRARLAAIGAKSIDAAVDATNYGLWDLGQPLHAFDLDKLAGGRIVVRKAKRGEKLVTLDGVERALEPSDVVVADGQRAISLAGIMGGLDTAVTPATKNVLLEAAWWDPVAVRRTSRRLGMHTDASHRFERGADPEMIPAALDLAARLLLEAAGGTLAPGLIDARGSALPRRRVVLRLDRLRMLAGDPRLDLDFAAEALARLGFSIATRSARRLTAEVAVVPPGRLDRRGPRRGSAAGVGLRPAPVAASRHGGGGRASRAAPDHRGRAERPRGVGGPPRDVLLPLRGSGGRRVRVRPLARGDRDRPRTARPRQSGGRLEAPPAGDAAPGDPGRGVAQLPARRPRGRRSSRSDARSAWTEIPRSPRPSSRGASPSRSGARPGRTGARRRIRAARISTTRRACSSVSSSGGCRRRISPGRSSARRRSSRARRRGAKPKRAFFSGSSGSSGETEREKRRLPDGVSAGEILVDAIPREARAVRFRPFSLFPPVVADLSISLPAAIAWESVDQFARGLGLANLESLRLFDRYTGPGVSEGQVKTTVRLTFRSAERTLEQEEVNAERDRLAAALRTQFGAES